jgi:hypothetical protein
MQNIARNTETPEKREMHTEGPGLWKKNTEKRGN